MVPIRLNDDAWQDVEEGTEALLSSWLVEVGDPVTAGQPVAAVEVAKTDFEVVAPTNGIIVQILIAEKDTFPKGANLAFLEETAGQDASISQIGEGLEPDASHSAVHAQPEVDATKQIVALQGLRASVARNTLASWQGIPHVTLMSEADVSVCQDRREALARSLGQKLSITYFVIRAVALALKEHPRLNARVTAEGIELVQAVNIGLAVDVEDGLLVPVIRDVENKSISELASEAKTLAEAARARQLKPSDTQGATFTVTSLGATRVGWFTPIINSPQVAILGVGAVTDQPIVKENRIAIVPMIKLSLVFDHRAIDGSPAASFLSSLCERIETGVGLN